MALTNFSRSLFLEDLIPQFVREEYPLFVDFLKEYYKYLDRKVGELACITITSGGKNYSSTPTCQIQVLDIDEDSNTYGEYIADPYGAVLDPYVSNGQIKAIRVTSYGSGYLPEHSPIVVITDSSGTGASATPHIITNIGNINYSVKQTQYARDWDSEIPILIEFLRTEYIPKIPKVLFESESASVELTKFVKFIKRFYTKAGVEDSIKFLYRILFNVDVTFYYPKVDMLRVSDGKWTIDRKLCLLPTDGTIWDFDNFGSADTAAAALSSELAGNRILVTGTGYTAIVESVSVGSKFGGGDIYLLNVSGLNGNPNEIAEGDPIYSYPVTRVKTQLGTAALDTLSRVYYEENGRYSGDDGQLSSTKRIQDSFYYQDFSYELQSEESIRNFSGLLEEILHPAGLKYFIRLNIENSADFDSSAINSKVEVISYPDSETNSEGLSFSSRYLGPTEKNIDTNKDTTQPIYFTEYTGTATLGSTAPTSSFVFNSTAASTTDDDYIGYTLIVNDGVKDMVSSIIDYNGGTMTCTLDSNLTPASTSVTYTLTSLLRPLAVDNVTREFTLSEYDFLTNQYWGTSGYHPHLNWRLYIVHGQGAGEFRFVTGMGGGTGIYTFDAPYGSTSPSQNSTYFLFPDLFSGATGATGANYGYWTGSVESIVVNEGGYGYVEPIISFEAPLGNLTLGSSATAGASAILGASGVITSITVTNAGSGYIKTPTITITDGATGPLVSHIFSGYAVLNRLADIGWESSAHNSLEGGTVLHATDLSSDFMTAKGYAEITSGSSVTSFTLTEAGLGYNRPPRILFIDGGYGVSVAEARAEIDDTGAVSSVVITEGGTNYEEDPIVEFEESRPMLGESVYQASTGAYGILYDYNWDANILYIKRGPASPAFDASDLTYSGTNINISISSLGGYWNTEGIRANNNGAESEIQVFK